MVEKKFEIIICADSKDKDNLGKVVDNWNTLSPDIEVKIISNFKDDSNFTNINENFIIEGLSYTNICEYFKKRGVKPSRIGWYLQQFLKMAYAFKCQYKNYLLWDADTIPVNNICFFDNNGKIFFDNSRIWEDKIFNQTVLKILGYPKTRKETYVTEHMMIDTLCMQDLIKKISTKNNVEIKDFWKTILDVLNDDELTYGGFSEFELIGTYMEKEHLDKISFRPLRSRRNIINLVGTNINRYDMYYFTKHFDFVTLEKTHKKKNNIKICLNKLRHFLYYKKKITNQIKKET